MDKKVIQCTLLRTTKSTGVYDEVNTGMPPAIKGMHLPLWLLRTTPPAKLQITVEVVQ